jgi:hypothetical protein
VGPTAKAEFLLRAGQIGKPALGAATLHLMRTHIAPIPASPHTSGSLKTEYYAAPVAVTVLP